MGEKGFRTARELGPQAEHKLKQRIDGSNSLNYREFLAPPWASRYLRRIIELLQRSLASTEDGAFSFVSA